MPEDVISTALSLERFHSWQYETDEMHGVCEIAGDVMVVRCSFSATTKSFFDVLKIDAVIRARLERPVSVERLAEQLAGDFPSLKVTVRGRAKAHGWISSTVEG